jgi:ribose transport system substrate-binding protein
MVGKKRKHRFKLLERMLTIALIFLVCYASYITYIIRPAEEVFIIDNGVAKSFIVLITDDVSSYSYDKFIYGVSKGAKELDVVLETKAIDDITNEKEIEDAFNIYKYSNVDGIMIKLSNNELAKGFITSAIKEGIKVVTIGNDSSSSGRNAYIGTNKYNLGVTTGSSIIKSAGEKQNVLVLLGSEYSNQTGSSNNNYINGILSITNQSKNINVDYEYTSNQNRAEIVVRNSLRDKDIDYIIVTDEIDSIRVTKTLIDINKINSVAVISSGDHPDILDYVKKGTVELSIVQNYELMGEKSLKILYLICNDRALTSYTSIPFKVIDGESEGDNIDKQDL